MRVRSAADSSDDRPNQSTTMPVSRESFCPICQETGHFWFSAPDLHYGNEGTWNVHRCQKCAHTYQFPIPKDDAELKRFYPKTYYAHQQRPLTVSRNNPTRGFRCRMQYLKYCRGYEHLPVRFNPMGVLLGSFLFRKPLHLQTPYYNQGGRVLDFGCGSGSFVAFLKEIGWLAEGIEYDESAAQAGAALGLSITAGSTDILETQTNYYQHIFAFHSIEHLVTPTRFFRAAYQALRPGGTLRIDVPNGASAAVHRFQERAYYVTMPVHVHLFSPKSLSKCLVDAGFSKIETSTYNVRETHIASWGLRNHAMDNSGKHFFTKHLGTKAIIGRLATLPMAWGASVTRRGDCIAVVASK